MTCIHTNKRAALNVMKNRIKYKKIKSETSLCWAEGEREGKGVGRGKGEGKGERWESKKG